MESLSPSKEWQRQGSNPRILAPEPTANTGTVGFSDYPWHLVGAQ